MKNTLVNYGFNEAAALAAKQADTKAYVLGVNSPLGAVIHAPDGQWPEVLYEPQAATYETFGCVIWGMETSVEMFLKKVYGFEPNYDERYIYLQSDVDVSRGGSNPQNAYEAARNTGLIDNEPMPKTLLEFQDKSYLTPARYKKGKEWLSKWTFKHDWLTDTSKETIKGALPLSPVGLAVTAWLADENGLYVDNGLPNTHWVVAFGHLSEFNGVKGIILKVFDTYDQSVKLLHPNHRISMAKRIDIREADEISEEDYLSVFAALQGLYNALQSLKEWLFPPTPTPINVPVKPEVVNNTLNAFCLAIQKHEGWFPNSRSQRNCNPGNVKYSSVGYLAKYEPVKKDPQGFAIFKDYATGFLYLKNLVKDKASKHPEWNLFDFFGEYAPIQDNNPIVYAENVAKQVGLDTKTFRMKHLL